MAASRKSERLMNLVICLLVSRRFVPKAKLRQLVEDYREQTPEAFEKMFERDKEELRELGIPIEVGQVASGFDDELGYRIQRSEFELSPLTFSGQEAAVLGLAARVWQHAGLAEATSRAVLKLDADGLDTDTTSLAALEPRLPAGDAAFEPLWRAVRTRTAVSFEYRRPGADGQRRTVEPWGVLNARGRWYVVGYDRDRAATRMFRLSRITGTVEFVGRSGGFDVPEGIDIRAEADRLAPAERRGTARIRVRAGAGNGLRRRAGVVRPDESEPGWDVMELSFHDTVALAEEVSAYGADALVLDPPDVRDAVIQRLKALLAEATR